MIEDHFNHTCDIYHIRMHSDSPGYGLPDSNGKHYYPESPDIEGLECHFGVKSANIVVNQTEPRNMLDARIKLTLPVGTDIHINDKVVNCDTGLEYTAEQPVNVRDHHLFVYIKRLDIQGAL